MTETRFSWGIDRNGYDLSPDRKRIVRRGGQLEPYSPDEDSDPPPHILFVDLRGQMLHPEEYPSAVTGRGRRPATPFWKQHFEDEAEAMLAFVSRFGFLGGLDHGADAPSETVEYLMEQQGRLSAYRDFGREGALAEQIRVFNASATTPATLRLQQVDGAARLQAAPLHLLSWMWTRAAEDLVSGASWTYCKWCGKPFLRGAGGVRVVAETCSASCRTMFNRRNAATKAKAKAKRKGATR